MLKIFRIRPCENNKSCSTFLHKSNKIGLAFVRIFYNFPHILQVSATGGLLFQIQFAPEPLEQRNTSQIYPCFTILTLERFGAKQFVPWGRRAAGSPEFRRLGRRTRAGKGSGSSRSSPRTYWWPRLGQRCRRRGSSTVADGGGRGGAVSGEEAARGGQGAGRACRAIARGGAKQLTRRWG
jgi:hypothetical protein